ncbi:MAG TPA: Mur ligase family protein, partial [Planctomycetota bacterium]|nr:Mur ligase family protein [Planctomycetota bacterium]
TSRCLDAILRAQGLRTGRYLSPHLESVRERIAVDGELIGEADFAAHVDAVLAASAPATTFFEAITAAACLHFAAARTDAVVLEVGLGGRLDATTAVPTTHTVITEISFDHMELLGSTLEAIAAEKAATIRTGVPVFTGVDPATGPGRVIREAAARLDAPFRYVPPPRDAKPEGLGVRWGDVLLPVLGRHQAHNAALAAAATGDLPWETVARGLAAARHPGCAEPRGGEPAVVVDGAHTVSSIKATVGAIRDHFPDQRPHLVFALAQDKDLDGIAAVLAPAVARAFCTRADAKRGRDAEALAAHPAWQGRAGAVPDAADALGRARAAAGPRGLVLVTGSFYLAGALRPLT